MNRCLRWARPLAGCLALIVGLTLAAPPVFAAEPQTATPAQPLAAAAAAKVNALPAATLAKPSLAQQAGPTSSGDKPFFKSGKGILAGVLLAATIGYMGYAMSHDRVKSPAK